MKIDAKHVGAANLLIASRFSGRTLEDISKEIGVTKRTLSRWRADSDFKALFDRMLEEHHRDIEGQPLAQRADRIQELYRLYLKLPDEPKHIPAKAKLIEQIADEAEEGKMDETAELVANLRQQLAEVRGDERVRVEETSE